MQMHFATPPIDSSMAIFAHELREPLASILLAAQSAVGTPNDEPTNREMWGIVERQSRYLARMIERVMELGRGSHGNTVLAKDWCDLGTTILNAVEAVQPLLVDRRHHLTVSLPPEPVFMLADGLRMQQVIVNLLANAAKYTGGSGRIGVRLEIANDRIVIEVRDNGVGITPDLLPRVFDLFRQGEKPCGSRSPGLGIGLALVKSLVELHGGSISAHSGGAGAGSAFVVLFPQTGKIAESAPELAWTGSAMLDA